MSNEKLDNEFRLRLHDAEVAPPAQVWPGVERALSRQRRRFFAWFLGSGLLLAGLAGLWLTLSPTAKNVSEHAVSAAPGNISPAGPTVLAAPKSDAVLPANAVSVSDEAEKNQPTDNLDAEKPRGISTSENRKSSASRSKSSRSDSQSFSPEALAASKINRAEFSATAATDRFFEKGPAENPDVFSAPNFEKTGGGPASDEPETTKIWSRPIPGVLAEPNFPKTARAASLDLLPLKTPEIASVLPEPAYKFPLIKPLRRKKQEHKNCYSFSRYGHAWLLDAYVGYARSDRSLAAKTADLAAYAARRNATERPALGLTAGLRGAFVYGPFLLRTGLHYSQLTEIFDHTGANAIRTVIVRDSVRRADGTWQVTEKTIKLFGDEILRTYNRYHFLDIPLLAGIEFRFGKAGLGLNAGGAANLLFYQRGAGLDPGGRPVRFTPGADGGEEWFRTNAGFSLMGSAQVFWHVRPRTRVFIEPSYQKILKSISLQTHPVAQKYQIFGINAGISHILD